MTAEQQKIEKLLGETKREGILDLLAAMEDMGFYTAPASTRFHGSEPGALAKHSLNVLECADKLASKWLSKAKYKELYPSIVICSLLHDLGKCGQFGKPLYIENTLKSGKASDASPYKTNDDLLTLPHEVVSCIEATKYIDLTEDEQRAIAWHNGLYGLFKYDIQGKETELYMIIHFADMWASRIIERKED